MLYLYSVNCQCCQPAEISAAEHKSGRKKIQAAEENGGRFCTKIRAKGAEKWPEKMLETTWSNNVKEDATYCNR
jgi:hypothetical protein